MINNSHSTILKLKLASYGALRPQAWTKILDSLKEIELNDGDNLTSVIGRIVFIAEGIVKEYDPNQRKKPSIVNFISTGNFLVTTKYNQSRYVKAIGTCKLIYLDFEQAISLFIKFNELKSIYNGVLANYENGIAYRQLILEENSAAMRITLFIDHYRSILPYLKKKEVANYVHLAYDYFIRMYTKML